MGSLSQWWKRLYHSIFTRVLLILVCSASAVNLWRAHGMQTVLSEVATTTVTAQQFATARNVADDIARELLLRESTLQQLARSLPAAYLDRPDALRAWLQERGAVLQPLFDGLVVERADGSSLAAYPPGQQRFQGSAVSEPASVQLGAVAQSQVLSVRVALPQAGRGKLAQLRGLTRLDDPGFLDTAQLHSNGSTGGIVVVFAGERLFWPVSDASARLQALPPAGASVFLDQAMAGAQPSAISVTPQGQAALTGRHAVPGTSWQVVAYMPMAEAMLPLEHWRSFLYDSSPYVISCIALVIFLGTFVLLRPVWHNARLADQMSRGETPLRRLPVARPDEFGALTAAFNRLLNRLEGQSLELTLQKEKAEAADLAKSRFLAAASHDLRQPMHALNLYLGALSHLDLPATAFPVMVSARECAQTMDDMFRALLDISRLDASAMQANISVFPMAPLLEKIRNNHVQQARAKGLALHVVHCSAYVSSDPELLERVLSNLVSNAVQYTEKGRILLGCRRGKAGLRVGVYDTGVGIALDQQRVVFEEFYQVGNAGRDRAQGLGLGLAIVQRLAMLLQAPLVLRSQPGRGSVFSIEVPLAQPAPAAAQQAAASFWRQDGSFKHALVAVIDDEPLIREATALLLRQWGCEVVSAASGAEAIERLSHCDRVPGAIVCDHRLRDSETGVDVIAALRMEFNSEIPAMLITGDTSPQRIQALQATGIPVLNKPLQDHVLMDALLRLLNGLPMA